MLSALSGTVTVAKAPAGKKKAAPAKKEVKAETSTVKTEVKAEAGGDAGDDAVTAGAKPAKVAAVGTCLTALLP